MTAPAKKATPKKAPAKKSAASKIPASAPKPQDHLPPAEPKVPEALRFSSKRTGTIPETVTIEIDGQEFTVTQPSRAYLQLVVPRYFSPEATLGQAINGMFDLLRTCLDPYGVAYIDSQIRNPSAGFDDDLLGNLVTFILERWMPELLDEYTVPGTN